MPSAFSSGALPMALALLAAGCIGPSAPGTDPGPPPPGAARGLFENVLVTHTNGPASEVTVAVNPTDPRNLVGGAKDYTLGSDPGPGCTEYNVWSGLYWSKDGGATWGNALMAGYPGDANETLLSTYTCNSDPVVVFGPDGTAYYSGLAYGGGADSLGGTGVCPGEAAPMCGRSIWIARSADGGATWEGFVHVATSDGSQSILDKQWFAVDPNEPQNLVMTWITFTGFGGQFYIAASFDGGASWTPAAPLAEIGGPIHQFAQPAFGPDGTVYVVWRNFGAPFPAPQLPDTPLGQPFAPQLMFTRNAPNTPGFAPARGIATVHDINLPNADYRASSVPSMAVDTTGGPRSGTIYIVWPDDQGGQADILLTSSADGGDTWSAPVKVNQDDSGADQFMPWATVDEEGGVNVVFYDRGYSPGNELLDITVARSVDGGATFGSVRVTPQSWALPEGCYHQAGFPFLGDYIGIAAAGGVLHPFWADGRNGRCDVVTAAIPYAAVGAPAAAEDAPAAAR